MAAAAEAASLDDLFLRLEAAGVMLRIDTDRRAHDGEDPHLGRVGARAAAHGRARRPPRPHSASDARGRSCWPTGRCRWRPEHSWCTAPPPGCSTRPWCRCGGQTAIRLQTIRAGFPCFNAALAGYVEATRDDDRERNRLCPPNTLPDSLTTWARMQVRGTLATRAFGAEPDIAEWANACRAEPRQGGAGPAAGPGGGGRHRSAGRCRGAGPRPPGRAGRRTAHRGWGRLTARHLRSAVTPPS